MKRHPLGFLAGALFCLGLAGCGGDSGEDNFDLVEVVRRPVEETFLYHAQVTAVDKVQVKSPFDSTLLWWADHGKKVEAQEVVARVDDVPLHRRMIVLEAALEAARLELDQVRFEQREVQETWNENIRTSELSVAKAKVHLEDLESNKNEVQILQKKNELAVSTLRLARFGRELEAMRPQVERGFVSSEEVLQLESEAEQLELGIARVKLELSVLERGAKPEALVDARYALERARTQLEKRRSQAEARVRLAETPVKKAEETLEEAKDQIRELEEEIAACEIRAPFAGKYLQPYVNINGVILAPGTRAFNQTILGTVVQGARSELIFRIPERHLPWIRPGIPVEFELVKDTRQRYQGEIDRVSRVSLFDDEDPLRVREIEVWASISPESSQDPKIEPGANARVEVRLGGQEEVLVVPTRALVGNRVELADGRVKKLELGRVGIEWAQVVSGLAPGDRVRVPRLAPQDLHLVPAERGTLVETYEEGGELVAASQASVYNTEADEWRTKINSIRPEGESVTTGTVVVELDLGDAQTEFENLQETYKVLKAEKEKVQVELKAQKKSQAEEIEILEKRLLWMEAVYLEKKAGSSPQEVARAKSRLDELEVDLESQKQKLEVQRKMADRGFAGKQAVAELEERVLQTQGQVAVAKLQWQLAQRGFRPSEIERARLDFESARLDLSQAKALAQRLDRKEELSLAAVEARLVEQEKDLERKQRQIDGYNLKAPRSGTVVYQRHWTDGGDYAKFREGEYVRRGEAVLAIADLSRSKIEGLVSEEVAWKVQAGMPAEFWMASFPDERYKASVRSLGWLPKGIPDGDGEQGFEVVLDVESTSSRLQPGVKVRFEIELARYQDEVLIPLTGLQVRAGSDVVQLANGDFQEVEILGRAEKQAAVRGLKEGVEIRVP